MYKLRFTPAAQDDFDAIESYIADDNPVKAYEFVRFLIDKINILSDFPLIGVEESVVGSGLPNSRKLIIKNYIAHYTIFEKENIIAITRILHGAKQNYKLV